MPVFGTSISAQQNCPHTSPSGYNIYANTSNCDIDQLDVAIKEIRVIYHVFQRDDGSQNIPDSPAGEAFIWYLHIDTNQGFENMPVMTMPTSSSHIADSKLRLKKFGPVYFWRNTAMWAKGNRFNGSHGRDLYNFVMSQNVPGKHTAIHIFIPGNFGATGADDRGGRASAIGCLEWSMLEDVYAMYQAGQNFWEHSKILRHEIGHNLSLFHAFRSTDYCNDTNGHTSSFKACSVDNNLMGYNNCQDAMTNDQVTRCHRFLHQNQWVLHSGQDIAVLDGTVSQSGNDGPMYTFTNTYSSSATITINSPDDVDLLWTKTSGSGSFSTANQGHTLYLSGLGTASFEVTWTENCLDYRQSITFANYSGSFRVDLDEEAGVLTVMGEGENLPQSDESGHLSIYSQTGELIDRLPITLVELQESPLRVNLAAYPPGTYRCMHTSTAAEKWFTVSD